MTIFSSELLGWNFLSSRFLIGTYYGILTTLPLAPSQLLSIRVLLLEDENKQGKIAGAGAAKGIFLAGVSGFLIAQFAMFLSIYCFPLYQLWFKPHLFNLLLPPFLLWHYLKIIEFDPVAHLIPNYQHPLFDPRVRTAFIESFLLQIINPIVLPNPVFTRLMSIFLFRYSNIPIFIFGSLIGWLSGQLLFISLSSILLSRLQLDSPAIYRIVKRIVHWAFPPIIMGIFLSYIGRVSMVPFDKRIGKQKILPYHLWPDICYNRGRISRFTHFMLSPHQSKFRNQTNAPFNTLNITLHKNHFSQYFFETCISDGKKRLSHNYPISISLIQNDLNNMIKFSEDKYILEQKWFKDKEIRLFRFNDILNNKFHNLDRMADIFLEKRLHSIDEHGLKMFNVFEYVDNNITYSNEFSKGIRKYIQSYHLLGNRIRKSYDPRLGNDLRKQPHLVEDESPWFTNQKKDNQISSKISRSYLTRWKINDKRLKRLKQLLSKLNINSVYFDLYKVIPVWKSRSKFTYFYHEFEILKKNLKRTRRRKFFMRSLVPGATFGRSRNIAGVFFQFLETKPRSSFFLRAKEIIIDSTESLDSQQRIVSQTEAEKFDFSSSHSSRGPALITQAFIRKYIKLPILIFGKSLVRLVLMHTSEWNQDWTEWSQEKYIYCYYNGNYVPDNQMPPHWLGDGLQIQILSPFHLTPWRPSVYRKNILPETINPISLKSSYINIWGQETDVPFGEVQHTPFFKPILKGFIIFSRYQLGRMLRIINQIWFNFQTQYSFVQSQFNKKRRIFDKQISRDTFLKKNRMSEDQIYVPNVNKFDLNPEIDQDFKNRDSFSLTKNIVSNSKLISVNDDDYKYKDHYSLIKESVRYNKLSIFPNNFIFQQTKKFIEYQITIIRIVFLRLYQKLIYTRKSVSRKIINLIRIFQIIFFQYKRNIVLVLRTMISKINTNIFYFKKIVMNFSNTNILLPIKLSNYEDILSDFFHYSKETSYLSHAYILHKIWQNNLPNRLPIQKMFINWEPNNVLKSNIQTILNQYGFLQNTPRDINANNFEEWLRPFRRYTPSPEIWNKISPHTWRDSVKKFWVKNSIFIDNSEYRRKIYTDKYSQYLSYFKPLFEKSSRITKRWQINLLINSYTNSLKNDHLYDVLRGWQTQNRQNIQLFNRKFINNIDHQKNIIHSKRLTWALTNTRNNGLVLSFPFNYINNKQPLYIKYKTRSRAKEENQFSTFKQRVAFRPIIQHKWKSEQDRSKALDSINIVSKVKSDLNNAIKNAMLAKKNKVKSLSMFEEKVKETTLQWKTLNLSSFICQTIKKRQAKIVDDEILMHTIISSFFNLKRKHLNTKNLGLLNSSLNQLFLTDLFLAKYSLLIPEDLFLAKTLREYRILSYFQFTSQNQINECDKIGNLSQLQKLERQNNIDIEYSSNPSPVKTYQEVSSHQIIKRYLWPSYRVEDLACMNRYWINTANQARFSNLRIRIYPDLAR
jgi:Ycf1